MKKKVIINAIIWASVLLATSILMKGMDSDKQFMAMIIHITGWLVIDQSVIRIKSDCDKKEN